MLMSISFIMPFSSLISIMVIGILIQKQKQILANRLSLKFNKLWISVEIILFVLVDATVNLKYALASGISAIILILGVII